MYKYNKKHNSCVRVLEFLKLLIQSDIAINDIYKTDKEDFKDIESYETYLKYITTLDFSGIKTEKKGKKYSLCNSVFTVEFSEREILLLLKIYEAFKNCCLEKQREDIEQLFKNIQKFMPKNTVFNEQFQHLKNIELQNTLSQKAQTYQDYAELHQKLKIIYNGEAMIVEPQNTEIENGIVYFNIYNPDKSNVMKLVADNIEKIEILPARTKGQNFSQTVVFEVYDRLAINYRLRECEYVESFTENSKIIVNSGEDKDLLIKRLLKYGENCQVLKPTSFRKDFIETLKRISAKLNGEAK